MKKVFILMFFLQLSSSLFSQKEFMCYLDFENNNFCYQDTLMIDYVSNPNNIWQIGKPVKTLFDSAYSMPNAIVTKLDSVYPVNDTSSFIIIHFADFALRDFGTMWINLQYQINSDTLKDYGTIEFSPDNGLTWINALTDTTYFLHWWNPKPVLSGNSDGWQNFEIWFKDPNHHFNIQWGDTVLWKFSFISDSVQSNKDGWMLDNIYVNDWYEGISEFQQNIISISPNPFSQSTQITLNQSYHSIALAVYDSQGKQVAQQQYADCDKIQFNRNQLSNGLYFLKLTLDDKALETGKIVISEK
jgi:hypothetical protein